ncbi:hypothetical protein [Bacillus sp. RSS_NA_20]|uniref:hypothetical protein n=1 Tax=Bacillus sp. RSS_NA_20 TaxID=2876777 RepID=UPI001CCD9D7A|nr:hypothetical protein [Bacillus sp. RSS_NA_20]MCA0117395.1 hypothetical protein [Bacillus sp. RSS_NA_20]
MREIKTEAQTLDLSKKVTVEVSLAELVAIESSLEVVQSEEMWERVRDIYNEDLENATRSLVGHEAHIAAEIADILDEHIPEED